MAAVYLTESQAWAGKKVIKKFNLVPSVFLEWPDEGPEHAIIVDKSLQKIYIFQKESSLNPVKTYNCSTGENNGPKAEKNDKRTPEGIYFITNSFVKRELSPVYGDRAFPLDYPNSLDMREGRAGYGIWFHGTNKPLKPNDTNGCIALENRDIDQMAAYIKLQETPVIISKKLEMVPPQSVEQEKKELEDIIEEWRHAWQEKDIDEYMAFYSPVFAADGKDWKEWKDYKTRLAEKYPTISVEIDDLFLLVNGTTALASFTQKYQTPSLKSTGKKRLYLKRNSRQWKIFAERFDGSDVIRPVIQEVKSSPREEIEKFIQRWHGAWEKKNMRVYISCYDRSFASRNMDLRAWKDHRARLNRKYRSLDVMISPIKIQDLSDHRAEINFEQDYRADGYHDFGLKTMVLIKKGEDWKISQEEWSPLKKGD